MEDNQKMRAELTCITPELAAEWLQKNTANRPISRADVKTLASDMSEGRYMLTHQGIAFTPDGTLLDGQHRLLAVIQSGVSVYMWVFYNVDPESFHAIDQIRKRTGAQIATMAGITQDAPRLIAMSRTILQVVHGLHRASNTLASNFALKHRDVLSKYLPVARRHTPAVAAAFAWADMLGWGEVESAASRLLEKMYTPGDPMRALDKRAETFKREGQGQAAVKARFDITLNALQAVHEGRELNVARTAKPDYAAIERASMRPPRNTRPSELAERAEQRSLGY